MPRCVLICASPEFEPAALNDDDYVIACDGGLAHAHSMGVLPDLVVGDFDSYIGTLQLGVATEKLNVDKDVTDTMYAVGVALDKGYRDFLMLGATGGRIDHYLSVLACGAYIAQHGGVCEIVGRGCRIYVICDRALRLEGINGHTVSVISHSDKCTGVTLRGFKWELTDAELTNTTTLGQSNLAVSDVCELSVKSGAMIIIDNTIKV